MTLKEKEEKYDKMQWMLSVLIHDFGYEMVKINNPSLFSELARLSREICHEKLQMGKYRYLRN